MSRSLVSMCRAITFLFGDLGCFFFSLSVYINTGYVIDSNSIFFKKLHFSLKLK